MQIRQEQRRLLVSLLVGSKDPRYRRGLLQLAVTLGLISPQEFDAWLVNPPTDP